METTILLVALVVFSFAISRLLARYASRFFVVSGVEYIVLGLLLGPLTGMLDSATLARFGPLIGLLLGLVGFILGLRAKETARAPGLAVAAYLSAATVLVVVGGVSLALIELVRESTATISFAAFEVGGQLFIIEADPDNLRLAGTIGCCAAVTSPTMIRESARLLRARGPALDALQLYSLASQILAVAVFGIVLASARATESADVLHLPVWGWAVGIALFGALSGLLFTRFIGPDKGEMRVYMAAVGVVTFASGVGVALGVSPLVVNLIAGMFVSFTSPHAERLEQTLVRLRHPVLTLVRLFAGAAWVGVKGLAWLLPPAYAATRIVTRRAVSHAAARVFARNVPDLPRLGYGLMGQGGLTAAIALSFAMRFPTFEGTVMTAVLGGLILSDLWSHRAVRRVLADAGELHVVGREEIDAELRNEALDTSGVNPEEGHDPHAASEEAHS